ncbi:hypothetical protein QL285_066404 [Trifolium repens]|nr:hypothetical protein QL285_066404 [Trifolium repens]
MKLIILLLFLVIISGVQAISNQDFNMNFTSEDTTINHTYEQPHHQFNGNLDGNGNIEVSTRLNRKVVLMESHNENKHELSVTIRRGGGGGKGGGRGGGGRGRAAGGGAAAGIIGAGVIGGSTYRGTHHSNSSATLLSAVPHVCVSTFILCLSFWL